MLCLTISDASLIPKKSLDMVGFRGVKSPKSKCDQNMYRRGGSAFKEFCPKKNIFLAASFSGPILNNLFLKEFNVNYTQTT